MKVTKWTMLALILALSVVGLSVFPSVAGAQAQLSDSEQPGSFIVFPKFIKGTVTVDGVVTPQSQFEVSVLCPAGQTCPAGQAVRLLGHWVCPGNAKTICKELDFVLTTTVNGTVTFDPSRLGITAPCAQGFLVMWVVNAFNQAIKFDGLIGDAVLRTSAASAAAYNGIPIQATAGVLHAAILPLTVGGGFAFDGAAGTAYRGVAGTVFSGLRFDNLVAPVVNTDLTMLTLDLVSNRPNTPTFVDFLFWNANEVVTSTSTDFICWAEQNLHLDIDGNLTQQSQGTAKGSFVGVASDTAFAARTLMMIIETKESNLAGALEREYSYSTYHNGVVIPTVFRP